MKRAPVRVTVEYEGQEPIVFDRITQIDFDIDRVVAEVETDSGRSREYLPTGKTYLRLSLTNDERAI